VLLVPWSMAPTKSATATYLLTFTDDEPKARPAAPSAHTLKAV
jgi:hypothetical protein